MELYILLRLPFVLVNLFQYSMLISNANAGITFPSTIDYRLLGFYQRILPAVGRVALAFGPSLRDWMTSSISFRQKGRWPDVTCSIGWMDDIISLTYTLAQITSVPFDNPTKLYVHSVDILLKYYISH